MTSVHEPRLTRHAETGGCCDKAHARGTTRQRRQGARRGSRGVVAMEQQWRESVVNKKGALVCGVVWGGAILTTDVVAERLAALTTPEQ